MNTFEHTFKDSGAVCLCQKVSPFIISEARAAAQRSKPKVPTRVVEEEGPLKGTVEEIATPEYAEQLRQWNRKADELLMRIQVKRSVLKVIEPENWQELVTEFRDQRQALHDELAELNPEYNPDPLPVDDLTVFIIYLAAATREDLTEFINEISTRSYPTGEVIASARESFPATVPQ